MTDHVIKGYCPGALTPMQSGDGLVLRLRPYCGRLTAAQATGIAALSKRHGNGRLDLSSRANLQIRGVSAASYPAIMQGLQALDLLDRDEAAESRRNLIVAPFWAADDDTIKLARALSEALIAAHDLRLPGKFGFVVDCGPTPVLQGASGDIRIERRVEGELLLVAEGLDHAKPVTAASAVSEALELAGWFMDQRRGEKRMSALLASGERSPDGHGTPRQRHVFHPLPGLTDQGALAGVAFGQLSADTFAALAQLGDLRLTPWRMVLVEGARRMPDLEGLISTADDPLLRVVACAGTDGCAQAHAETRTLARQLAPHIAPHVLLHVSGCTKGCALPKPADLTVTATAQGYDLIPNGCASDLPAHTGLDRHTLSEII